MREQNRQVAARTLLPWLVCLALLAPGRAQQGDLDGSETLFTVMAAINMAGYDADLDSPSNHPLRREIRRYLAARNLNSIAKIREFFEQHRQDNWTAELSQYVSYALIAQGPPAFQLPRLTYDLPPDVQRLAGLSPLLEEFYREADIGSLYQKAQPAFEEVIARYHEPVSRAVFELNGYLRNPTSGVSGSRFRVVVSLLAAPNQIHTRSYRGDYAVVVSPSPELQIEEIRYAYLHYLLEPAVTRNAPKLEEKRALGDYALGAPFLPEHYKRDFLLLATSSLIKAIEARLAPVPEAEKKARVEQAYRLGYILAPHFAEQLPVYEKQEQSMQLYFGQMVEAIDLAREEARAQNLEFLQERPVRLVKPVPVAPPEPTGAQKALEEAEELYRKRDLENARQAFLKVLRDTNEKPLQARAYYGLARVATLMNDGELARSLFEKTLESAPDPPERAWALVYLGRLSDVAGEADKAAEYYREALATEGASPAAREMAAKGAAGAFRRTPAP